MGEWATRERGLWPKHAIKADDLMEEFLDLFDPTKRGRGIVLSRKRSHGARLLRPKRIIPSGPRRVSPREMEELWKSKASTK